MTPSTSRQRSALGAAPTGHATAGPGRGTPPKHGDLPGSVQAVGTSTGGVGPASALPPFPEHLLGASSEGPAHATPPSASGPSLAYPGAAGRGESEVQGQHTSDLTSRCPQPQNAELAATSPRKRQSPSLRVVLQPMPSPQGPCSECGEPGGQTLGGTGKAPRDLAGIRDTNLSPPSPSFQFLLKTSFLGHHDLQARPESEPYIQIFMFRSLRASHFSGVQGLPRSVG